MSGRCKAFPIRCHRRTGPSSRASHLMPRLARCSCSWCRSTGTAAKKVPGGLRLPDQGEPARSATSTSDGYVNVGDLQALVAAWGSQAGPPPSSNWNADADINGDGYVNVGDLQTARRPLGRVTVIPGRIARQVWPLASCDYYPRRGSLGTRGVSLVCRTGHARASACHPEAFVHPRQQSWSATFPILIDTR